MERKFRVRQLARDSVKQFVATIKESGEECDPAILTDIILKGRIQWKDYISSNHHIKDEDLFVQFIIHDEDVEDFKKVMLKNFGNTPDEIE
jgi:hypothetical protein